VHRFSCRRYVSFLPVTVHNPSNNVQEVEPENRGAFSSTEASWHNTFELLSYATTIFFSRPEQFQWPVLMSFIAVFTSCNLFAAFVKVRAKCFGGKWDERVEFGYETLP